MTFDGIERIGQKIQPDVAEAIGIQRNGWEIFLIGTNNFDSACINPIGEETDASVNRTGDIYQPALATFGTGKHAEIIDDFANALGALTTDAQ